MSTATPPLPPPPVRLRRSAIHGTGVFATRAIAAGERIIEYKGERVTKAESRKRGLASQARTDGTGRVYIFELNKRYDLDGDVPDNPAKYINHSCDENCEATLERGRIWIYAKRDIAPAQELTFDYGYALEHFMEHPCRCGAPHCVGYIVHRMSRLKLRQMLARSRKAAR
ncbi:MAG: SET domain-containing protein-lysine N-methyltransferase [Puniceicoccales bacterium]|jgi:SET domain-containing protein|nr:SET domain-containing protein-lysine N-methyltransferase [Puniceicoccales bacterium]